MYKHLLILPDGTELFSGAEQENALQSVNLTEAVNSGEELNLGSVCACELRADLITPFSGLTLTAGDRVTAFRVDDDGTRTPLGVFYLEKPEKTSAHTMRLTAYDAVSLLDQDLTQWLADLSEWPYAVPEFAQLVCDQCGVTLLEQELPNADFYIQPFAGEGITGRMLMQWLGQITGRFCRANADGRLEFAWYTPNNSLTIAPAEGDGGVFCYQGELEFGDYQVAAVEKIQLRQTSDDIGTVWPDEAGEKNTYIIENNPMLAAQDSDTLLSVAQNLYTQLQNATYTPCRVAIPATPEICAGDIVTVTDANGRTFPIWVMQKISNGQRDTLSCTGSHRRDSTTAVNNLGFRALSGKVLNLRTDVDGIKAENRDTQGKLASVELDLDGIRSRVESQNTALQGVQNSVSALTQTAQSLTLELTSIRETGTDKVKTGVGYTFDDKGLQISRSDSDMENLLDHTGMYVRRSGQVVLQANNQGVQARDVSVGNYLIIGENARIEDYSGDRTACFYIG